MKKLNIFLAAISLCTISASFAEPEGNDAIQAHKQEIVEKCVNQIEAKPSEELKAWKFDSTKYCECMFNVGLHHKPMKEGMLNCFKQFEILKDDLKQIEEMIDSQQSE